MGGSLFTAGAAFLVLLSSHLCSAQDCSTYNCVTYTTPWNINNQGQVIYLDRHKMDCPDYFAITSYHLEANLDQIRCVL